MLAVSFVNSLLERGAVRVPGPTEPSPGDWADAVAELDRAVRPEMAFDPPPVDEPAAIWGLQMLYRGCQCLAHRDVDAETVGRMLAEPCPSARASAAACYSVDLALRYLPDLLSLARGIAPDDPLVTSLMRLANAWPLSSVGVKGVGEIDIRPFANHPSLRQLYVDRIIARSDVSRLGDAGIAGSVRAAVGNFPELAPAIVQLLPRADGSPAAPPRDAFARDAFA